MLAKSFGIKGIRINELDELDYSLDEIINTDGPVIADIRIEKEENCFPMIPSGAAHNEMILSADDKSSNSSEVSLSLV